MRFVSSAWYEVSPEIIMKCFRKAGIAEEAAESSDDEEGGQQSASETDREEDSPVWRKLGEGMRFGSYVDYDKDVAVCGEQSIADIVDERSTREEGNLPSEEDTLPPPPVPSFKEAAFGYYQLKRYLLSKSLNEEEIATVLAVERVLLDSQLSSLHQANITDYFQSSSSK